MIENPAMNVRRVHFMRSHKMFAYDGYGSKNADNHQWRIQDFPQGGAPTPKIAIIFQIFAKNCMKMKEFGPPRGGARPWRPPRSANDHR